MTDQPNIIVILVDRLRRDALGHMGDPNVETSNIDAMAHQGVAFTAASATSPNGTPFRFSLMTGEYAHSRSVPALGYRLSPAEKTIGEAMQANGYATALVGKWGLYGLCGATGTHTTQRAGLTPVPAEFRRGFDYWRGFDIGTSFNDCHYFADDDPAPHRMPGLQSDGLFDLAISYADKDRPGDRPFFLLLSLEAPSPLQDGPPVRQPARGIKARENVDLTAIHDLPPPWRHGSDTGDVTAAFTAATQSYYAMVENIDANIGRLRNQLAEAGLDQSTIILFLSDHGEMAGSHGLFGAGQPYEEAVGIPLIAFSANPTLIKGDRQPDLPVCTEDLFPTLLGLAGGTLATRPGRCDLSSFLRGTADEPDRDAVLLEFVAELHPTRPYYRETWRGIRTRRHKYTVLDSGSGGMPWQLFDLQNDPFEQENLILEPDHAQMAEALHDKLRKLLIETADDYQLAPFSDDG